MVGFVAAWSLPEKVFLGGRDEMRGKEDALGEREKEKENRGGGGCFGGRLLPWG